MRVDCAVLLSDYVWCIAKYYFRFLQNARHSHQPPVQGYSDFPHNIRTYLHRLGRIFAWNSTQRTRQKVLDIFCSALARRFLKL